MRYAINGLLSLTCDGSPILGESLVKGLWTAAAVWIKEGPGVGRAVAEWMVDGTPRSTSTTATSRGSTRTRCGASTPGCARPRRSSRPTASCTRPSSTSPTATSGSRPMHESQKKLGAVFFETAGWERPHWYESNAGLLDAVRRRRHAARARVGRAVVEPDHQRRAPAPARGRRGHRPERLPDPGHRGSAAHALDTVQRACVAQCDVPVGRVVYTPVLDAKGGFKSDLTVMRLGENHFRVVTGGAHGRADSKWFSDLLTDDGDDPDRPDRRGLDHRAVGTAGPRHPGRPDRATDVSDAGFGFLTCREITVGGIDGPGVADLLRRRARLGALRRGRGCRGAVGDPARGRRRSTARCRSASASTARPAGSRRATARSATSSTRERSIVEAGMQRPEGQGGRLRRPGGLPRRSARRSRRRCCAP